MDNSSTPNDSNTNNQGQTSPSPVASKQSQQGSQLSNGQLADKIYPHPQSSQSHSDTDPKNATDTNSQAGKRSKNKMSPVVKVLIGALWALLFTTVGATILVFFIILYAFLFYTPSTSSGSKTM